MGKITLSLFEVERKYGFLIDRKAFICQMYCIYFSIRINKYILPIPEFITKRRFLLLRICIQIIDGNTRIFLFIHQMICDIKKRKTKIRLTDSILAIDDRILDNTIF